MHPLFAASFVTLTTLLVDLRGKCKQPINRYIALFFLIAGIGYFFQAIKAEASEIQPYGRYLRSKDESRLVAVVKNNTHKTKNELDKELIENCWKKAHYHYEEGCKCLKEAEEISLLFPDLPDFDKAQLPKEEVKKNEKEGDYF